MQHLHKQRSQKRNSVKLWRKTKILLQYTAEHNEHHADELNPLIEAMRAAGRDEAADLAEQARAAFTRGTELLREALDAYTQEC